MVLSLLEGLMKLNAFLLKKVLKLHAEGATSTVEGHYPYQQQ